MRKQTRTVKPANLARMMWFEKRESPNVLGIVRPMMNADGDTDHFRPQAPSSLFFQYNTALSPPYSVLVDTNFISHTIQHKLEVIPTMMDCLYAKCIPIITDCVLAELEKLGQKYRLALRVAKDPRFERIKCDHKGTYADDCLVDRVIKHRVYIVATNDRDLKRRIR